MCKLSPRCIRLELDNRNVRRYTRMTGSEPPPWHRQGDSKLKLGLDSPMIGQGESSTETEAIPPLEPAGFLGAQATRGPCVCSPSRVHTRPSGPPLGSARDSYFEVSVWDQNRKGSDEVNSPKLIRGFGLGPNSN